MTNRSKSNVVPLLPCELEIPVTADEFATVQARAAMAGLTLDAYVRRQISGLLSEGIKACGPAEED